MGGVIVRASCRRDSDQGRDEPRQGAVRHDARTITPPMQLPSGYLAGAWVPGSGSRTTLVNPATEAPLAEAHQAFDAGWAVAYAREVGRRELGGMSFAQRGALLGALAKAIHAGREELIALAVANGGNTRGDAKFDIDGAAFTLSHYAEAGAKLGDSK